MLVVIKASRGIKKEKLLLKKIMENSKELVKQKTEKEKAFSSINLRSFLMVAGLLVAILIIAGVVSNFIPQGHFSYDEVTGAIIPGTYQKGEIKGIELWRVVTAPVRVFFSEDALTIIMICVFLLIMSGVFNIMDKTGGVKALIAKITKTFANKKTLAVLIIMLFFMLFGSFFGMYEELITLLPIIIIFSLSLGYDTMTGLGMGMLSACFGFAAAITNPFSVGLASDIAGVPVTEGVWLRVLFFVLVFAVLCTFMLLYIRRITKNPKKSLSFRIDREKLKNIDLEGSTQVDEKVFKAYMVFFLVQLVLLVLIASVSAISSYAIPILAVSFLIGGFASGIVASGDKKMVAKEFLNGAISMLPAIAMIAIASSIKLVLQESQIIDTIMNSVIVALEGQSKGVAIILIYILIIFLQIFISSASAKIFLIMPIVVPICEVLGISSSVVILTYCMGDGFTDMLLPTNPILLIGLSVANVSYSKWIKLKLNYHLPENLIKRLAKFAVGLKG